MQTTRRQTQPGDRDHIELAAELLARESARALGIRFALKYALFAGMGFVVYGYPYSEQGIVERGFERYLAAYASAVGAILRLFEPGLEVMGSQLLGRFPLQIAKNCDAIEANILLVGALLAFPAALPRRILAGVIGVLLLAVLNVVRITSLYFVGVHARGWFEFAHVELWPLLLIAFAAIEFLLLARWMQGPELDPIRAPERPVPRNAINGIAWRVAALIDFVRTRKWRGNNGS